MKTAGRRGRGRNASTTEDAQEDKVGPRSTSRGPRDVCREDDYFIASAVFSVPFLTS
jgi:hypothetical protein